MKRPRSTWWALVELGALAVLFLWLRWYSPFWQNRWTGFCLGLALVLSGGFNWRQSARQQLEFRRKYEIPKRVTILGAIVFPIMGIAALKSFWVGVPFFSGSGVRAASDNGFFTVILCAGALESLYECWLLITKGSDASSQNPVSPINHG